jgi:hypothetical protein
MNKERLLVGLIVADVLLAFAVIGAEIAFSWTLPGPLRDYAFREAFSLSSVWDFSLLFLWATTISCTLVAWVGMMNYWWFARRLYVMAWCTWLLLVLVSGPSVMNPVSAMFSTLESVVGGAIIGLVYFSDLSRHFERRVPQACPAS